MLFVCVVLQILSRVGNGALAALVVSMMMTTTKVSAAAARSEDVAVPIAEPSQYSAAYAYPSQPAGPYDGAVASTYANVVRVPGQHGHAVVKAASHKTVDTPFSTAHKSEVRFINDADVPYYPAPYAGPYPYAPATPAVVAGHYPYAPAAPAVVTGPYNPYAAVAPGPYPYATGPYPYAPSAAVGPYGPYAAAVPINKSYGYGPVAHSVSHASYTGPYGAHYSYKRRR